MIRIPSFDPIEYLVGRKFPGFKALESPPPLNRLSRGGISAEDRQRRLQTMQAFRASLKAKSADELRALVEEEKAKEQQERLAMAQIEEQARFFNQPHAQADFNHWSKAVYWTLDEALALAFGKAPEVVNWEKVHPYVGVSPFARQYARVQDLAMRAKNWKQLFDPVMPGIFLAWARRTEIEVPDELVKVVEARGIVVADWKDIYDKLKVQFDALVEDRDKVVAICQKLIEERDALKGRAAELEEQAAAWQFDESAENYPSELDVAMQAWWAVTKSRDPAVTAKQQLLAWLEKNYPKLTEEAKERIATVCNWEKRGGRPAQS